MIYSPRPALTPTLSRKRERGRAAHFIDQAEVQAAAVGEALLPPAGEGGPKGLMKVRRSAGSSSAHGPNLV
jgi:hypothetical protein